MTASKASEPTPRTDDQTDRCMTCRINLVDPSFARTLERDLQKAEARAAELELEKEQRLIELDHCREAASRTEAAEKRAAEAEHGESHAKAVLKSMERDLRSQLAAAELDAGRYRWLRGRSDHAENDTPTVFSALGFPQDVLSGPALDAAVDEQIEIDDAALRRSAP